MLKATVFLAAMVAVHSLPAHAQESEPEKAPWRTRVTLGPQLVPSFPGSDKALLGPLIGVSRARGDKPFAFSAPDDSFGPSLVSGDVWQFGPALGFEGKRSREDTANLLPEVKFSFEAGAFVQYAPTSSLRLRAEARKGISGHKGIVGTIGADFVTRDRDLWLFSLGPRVTLADGRYQRAYFGVTPGGLLPAFRPKGGVQAVGAATSVRRQLGERVGVYGYAKYDRLIDDAGRSPVVRTIGTRNQISGGIALSYTFGPMGG